jgi:hypothetical protein
VLAELVERHEHDLEPLGRLSLAPRVVRDEHVPPAGRVRAVGHRPGRAKRRREAGLLAQLPRGGLGGLLAAVDVAARQLEQPLLRAGTELAHEHHLSRGRHRHDDGRVLLDLDLELLHALRGLI